MANIKFGDIVQTNFNYSERQDDVRKFGKSNVFFGDLPATYHAGDTVHLPYASGEVSSLEAMGLCWSARQSGVI